MRELRLSLISAPTSRAPLLPQDACATFCDETFDVIVYVAVQGLAKRGDEVALSWLKSRAIAAGAARAIGWNASRLKRRVTGNIANPLGDRVLERLSGLLASSIETVLSTNAGNGRVGVSAHAMAGFFSMPTDDTTILFACGPIEIGVLDDAGRTAICTGATGPHGVEVSHLKLLPVPTTWQSIRGVVSFEREAAAPASRPVERVEVGNTKTIGEEADASGPERELRRRLELESPSFRFERNGASTAKPSSKRFEHAG